MSNGYFRELRQYSVKEIADILGIDSIACVKNLIGKLMKCSVLKAVSRSKKEYDRVDESNEFVGDIETSTKVAYVFNYVGIVIIDKYIIKCYPKYIRLSNEPEIAFKTVLRVMQKINSDNPTLNLSGGGEVSPQEGIALKLYILDEFYRRGLYIKERESTEENGEGEILWDETLEEQSYCFGGNILHIPMKTLLIEDDEDYYTNLHKCILSQISRELEENGMTSLFELTTVFFSSVSLADFDSTEHILYMLEREEREQYVTWKRALIRALHAYVAIGNTERSGGRFELYGTNTFHVVWEKVCKAIFGACLGLRLSSLPGTLSKHYSHRKKDKLIDIVEKPVWYGVRENAYVDAQGTFEPDLIGIYSYEKQIGHEFWIFDAKYYYYTFEKKKNSEGYIISGQPGVEDVAKQYMYEIVYREFIESQSYVMAHNVFLTPTEESTYYFGYVRIGALERFNSKRLKNIEIIKLNAEEAYKLYLNGNKVKNIIDYFHNIFSKNITDENGYDEGEKRTPIMRIAENMSIAKRKDDVLRKKDNIQTPDNVPDMV